MNSCINYISEKETQKFIWPILDLFKTSHYQEVLDLIVHEKINPQYSENIISDYAAIWLKEPEIVEFFKQITKIGGQPTAHHTIVQNVIKNNKLKALEYLLTHGALEHCKADIVYMINAVVLNGNESAFEKLAGYVDFSQYCLSGEANPSCINRVIAQQNEDMLYLLFEKEIIQPFVFSEETAHQFELIIIEPYFKRLFIEQAAQSFNISAQKYLQDDFSDMPSLLKTMHYDVLAAHLPLKEKKAKYKI